MPHIAMSGSGTGEGLQVSVNVLWELWELVVRGFQATVGWFEDVLLSMAWIGKVLQFVETHPHPFHIISWSIFFGPIIILVPLLLLLELTILFLFYLTLLTHGFGKGTMHDRFHDLKEYFMDTRENLFATVEHWTAVFNHWTVSHPVLLVFRLVAAGVGFILFCTILERGDLES